MLKKLNKDTLILGPRPGKKSFDRLSELNLTHCCTLLSEREQAPTIERISRRLNCEWIWLPIEGGHLETLRALEIEKYVETFFSAIAQNAHPRVYLHCSAGIHRTGFFAYLLLRADGWTQADATRHLAQLRPVTADQVGDERIALAEQMFQQSRLGQQTE